MNDRDVDLLSHNTATYLKLRLEVAKKLELLEYSVGEIPLAHAVDPRGFRSPFPRDINRK